MAYQFEPKMSSYERKILTPVKYGIAQGLSENLIDETYLGESVDVILEEMGGSMVVALTTRVMTETIAEHTKTIPFTFQFNIPASWWDDFKLQRMPEWFTQRFPVRYKTSARKRTRKVSFKQFAKYPNVRPMPRGHEFYRVMESTIEPEWGSPEADVSH